MIYTFFYSIKSDYRLNKKSFLFEFFDYLKTQNINKIEFIQINIKTI
jgi:hypothetical protein